MQEIGKTMANGKSVFDNLKSKLGLGGEQDHDGYDEYDDYEEYDEYDDYEDNQSSYEEYDPYAGSTAPRSFGNRNTVTTRNVRGGSHARLVSTSDAAQAARGTRDLGLGAEGTSTLSARRSGGRTMVDSSLPPTMTPEGTAAMSAASNRRSSGLDSLFSSTVEGPEREEVKADTSARASRAFSAGSVSGERESSAAPSAKADAGQSSFTAGSGKVATTTSAFGHRQLQVMRPTSYNDAEAVVRALKAGEVAVLVMGSTAPDLAKRILDFAFGAACALGANVESPAQGVFAVAIGSALSEAEKSDLAARGAL
jgi:cell division inhibitor SepF